MRRTGSITYVGAHRDMPRDDALANGLLKEADVGPIVAGMIYDAEIAEPNGTETRVRIVINHAKGIRTLSLPRPMKDIVGDVPAKAMLIMAPHGVLVLILIDPAQLGD